MILEEAGFWNNSAKKNQLSGLEKDHFQYLKFRKIQFLVSWKKWRIIQNWQKEEIHIPFAYELETAEVFSVGLRETYCYTISGRTHTGKTNVLKLLMYGAQKAGGKLCVIEPGQTELKKTAQECGAQYLTDTKTVFEYFKELTPTFVARNKKKRALIEEGADEERIYREMYSETPVYIFLSDLKEFFKLIYSADAEVGKYVWIYGDNYGKGTASQNLFLWMPESRRCNIFDVL